MPISGAPSLLNSLTRVPAAQSENRRTKASSRRESEGFGCWVLGNGCPQYPTPRGQPSSQVVTRPWKKLEGCDSYPLTVFFVTWIRSLENIQTCGTRWTSSFWTLA